MIFDRIYYPLLVLFFGITGNLLYFKYFSKTKYSIEFKKRTITILTIRLSVFMFCLVLFGSINVHFGIFIGVFVYGLYLLYQVLKRRESPVKAIFYLTLSGMVIPEYFCSSWHSIFSIFFFPVMLFAMGYISRNPWDNPYWYEIAITEAKKELKTDCVYTSRPIILTRHVPFPFLVYYRGIRIWFKREKVIFKISEKAYNRLDKPELKLFATKFADRILDAKYPTFDQVRYPGKNI